jgi:hypothetical protein
VLRLVTNVDKCLASTIRCADDDLARVQAATFSCQVIPFPTKYLEGCHCPSTSRARNARGSSVYVVHGQLGSDQIDLFEFFHGADILPPRFINESTPFVNELARELNELSHFSKTKLYPFHLRNN